MPLRMASVVELAGPVEPARSLLRAARTLPTSPWGPGRVGPVVVDARCWGGVTTVVAIDCDYGDFPADVADGTRASQREWTPYLAWVEDECVTLGRPERLQDQLREALRADRSRQVANEFWTGAAATEGDVAEADDGDPSGNLYLAHPGSTRVASGVALPFVEGFARMEAALAECAGASIIHASPVVATLAAHHQLVVPVAGALQTVAMGTQVIVDAGYPGTGPATAGVNPAANANAEWIYGTGPVFQVVGDVADPMLGGVDTRTNRERWRVEQPHLVLWDGCCHYAAQLDLTATIPA